MIFHLLLLDFCPTSNYQSFPLAAARQQSSDFDIGNGSLSRSFFSASARRPTISSFASGDEGEGTKNKWTMGSSSRQQAGCETTFLRA